MSREFFANRGLIAASTLLLSLTHWLIVEEVIDDDNPYRDTIEVFRGYESTR